MDASDESMDESSESSSGSGNSESSESEGANANEWAWRNRYNCHLLSISFPYCLCFGRCCLYIRATVLLLGDSFYLCLLTKLLFHWLARWAAFGGIGCPSLTSKQRPRNGFLKTVHIRLTIHAERTESGQHKVILFFPVSRKSRKSRQARKARKSR